MQAMVIQEFGGPEVFEAREVPKPEPGPDQLLVKVHATSVNPVDYKVRRAGSWAGVEPPAVIGYDVSGVVEAVGQNVSRFAAGDEVFYTPEIFVGQGSYAAYHAVDEDIVGAKPAGLSHVEAASLPLAGCTAWEALIEKANLLVGEGILIHGVGGVGSLAVQIAHAAGAFVIAVCSDYMVERAAALGADVTVDYQRQDFVDVVVEATEGYGVDVVLDTVGGDTLTRSLAVTKPFGRMVGLVSTDTGFADAFVDNITIYPTFLQRTAYKLEALRVLVERGLLEPVIDRVMPLSAVAEAHRDLESGGVAGKIVLRVAE